MCFKVHALATCTHDINNSKSRAKVSAVLRKHTHTQTAREERLSLAGSKHSSGYSRYYGAYSRWFRSPAREARSYITKDYPNVLNAWRTALNTTYFSSVLSRKTKLNITTFKPYVRLESYLGRNSTRVEARKFNPNTIHFVWRTNEFEGGVRKHTASKPRAGDPRQLN